MAELEEKLESILGNPGAMAQIMALAKSLDPGGGGKSGAAVEQAAPPPPAEAGAPSGGPAEDPGLPDPRLLSAAAGLLGQYSGGDDKRTALLNALRPFVREERYARLDKAIQIARLSRLVRGALELFRAAKEDGHV